MCPFAALSGIFSKVEGVVRAKRKPYIPVVLSKNEVNRVIDCLRYPYDLVVKLLYGYGLRLSECMKLRVKDFNFDHSLITIHDGKGKKDRTVPMPEAIREDLECQVRHVADVHQSDLKAGYSGVFMPDRLEVKYKNAPKELIWQWSGDSFDVRLFHPLLHADLSRRFQNVLGIMELSLITISITIFPLLQHYLSNLNSVSTILLCSIQSIIRIFNK